MHNLRRTGNPRIRRLQPARREDARMTPEQIKTATEWLEQRKQLLVQRAEFLTMREWKKPLHITFEARQTYFSEGLPTNLDAKAKAGLTLKPVEHTGILDAVIAIIDARIATANRYLNELGVTNLEDK